MSELSPEQYAEALLPKLRSPRIFYFPIRHHSPACAALIEKWILENKPKAVLVEGPASFSSRIDDLLDDACRSPVALYTNFVDRKGRLDELFKLVPAANNKDPDYEESAGKKEERAKEQGEKKREEEEEEEEKEREENAEAKSETRKPETGKAKEKFDPNFARYAAFYPFCDYSPELAALRAGRSVAARLRFIDLEYAEMVLSQYRALAEDRAKNTFRVESLAEDTHLKHSQYMNALARRLSCRDFDELWDHLFESSWQSMSTDDFVNRLATYCAMARFDYSDFDLDKDGTRAREACMAHYIQEELEKGDGLILVVTGGFHTVALPDLVASSTKRPQKPEFMEDEVGVWLMRYSFDRLDSLSGYSAGMPSPAFYEKLWLAQKESDEKGLDKRVEFEKVAANIILEVAAKSRQQALPNLISTPDAMAAAQMSNQLARLRGHSWPMREDILDGIRASFVKGEIEVEGLALMRIVKEVLAGNRIGEIPPCDDLPPIVADFYQQAKRYRLTLATVEKKEYALELYKSSNHRSLSRLFHRLNFLNIHFARFLSGPDFVTGRMLDLMIEHWEVVWSPLVESTLIEQSVYGNSIEEAAGNKLIMQIAALEENSQGRSSSAAVTLLTRACRMGLHAQSARMLPLIDQEIAEDPLFPSLVSSLSQLELLQKAREPLEASALKALPQLLQAAYLRACHLIPDLANCPENIIDDVIGSFQMLKEVLSNYSDSSEIIEGEVLFDSDLFVQALFKLSKAPGDSSQTPVLGAAAGILFSGGYLSNEELAKLICGYLKGAITDPRKAAGIVRGLLRTACEVAWQVKEVLEAINEQFESWTDDTFLEILPELRLAFATLSPRDLARVADQIAQLHDGKSLGNLVFTDMDETEAGFGLLLNEEIKKSLVKDGLTSK